VESLDRLRRACYHRTDFRSIHRGRTVIILERT